MTISAKPRLDPASASSVAVPAGKVRPLGIFGNKPYVTYQDGEYQHLGNVMADFHPPRGDLIVAERVVDDKEGWTHERTVYTHYQRVPKGTLNALAEQAAAKAAVAARRDRQQPIDMLRRAGSVFAGKQDRIAWVGPGRSQSLPDVLDTLRPALGEEVTLPNLNPRNEAMLIPGVAPTVGGAAIVQFLEAKGVSLSLAASGRLLPRAKRGAISDQLLEGIQQAERLIVADLSGHPLRCEVDNCGRLAETVVALGVVAALECARGKG